MRFVDESGQGGGGAAGTLIFSFAEAAMTGENNHLFSSLRIHVSLYGCVEHTSHALLYQCDCAKGSDLVRT